MNLNSKVVLGCFTVVGFVIVAATSERATALSPFSPGTVVAKEELTKLTTEVRAYRGHRRHGWHRTKTYSHEPKT
jgi:hypothetical protein